MLVWGRIMQGLHPKTLELAEPPGIRWQWIDRRSLTASTRFNTDAVALPFIAGTAPEGDAINQGVRAVEQTTRGLIDSFRGLFR